MKIYFGEAEKGRPMKNVFVVLLLLLLVGAGCTHNLTKLNSDAVYSRTTDAQTARMDADGNLSASYHGVGPTQLFQDPNGNWTNMPGPVGVLSVPMPGGGVAYIISPNNTKIDKMSYTPMPAAGSAVVTVEGLETNISEPMEQQVAALAVALPILRDMTKEEALATIERWRIAGDMLPTVAELLTQIVSGW